MKLLKLFSTKPNGTASGNVKQGEATSHAGSSRSLRSSSSNNSKKSKSKSKKRERKVPKEIDTPKSVNRKAAENFMVVLNTFDPENPMDYVDKFVALFESKDSPIVQEDGVTHTAEECGHALRMLYESFPDLTLNNASITEVNPHYMTCDGCFPQGHFTGVPYTPLPGVLPPVAPTGKHVAVDEERYCLTLKDGVITEIEVIAMGNVTGFAGMYVVAGGSLAPPSEEPVESDQ